MTEPSGDLHVFVATPFGRGGRGGMDRLTDIVVESFQERSDLRIRTTALVTYGAGSKFWMPFIFFRSLVQLWTAKARNEVGLLHINVAGGLSPYRKAVLARLARLLGVPYVIHLHGSRFKECWPTGGLFSRGPVDRMFTQSASIIVLGHTWARLISDNLQSVKAKIVILPNATRSVTAYRLAASGTPQVHISFLGELGARKGTGQLIEALGLLRHLDNWAATIAGNGDVEKYRKLAQDIGLGERLQFPGWLGPDEVNGLLGRSDIFVLPSFAENLPMAVLEAFAHGLAVVSTPVGAVSEVIDHGRNGLIVPVGDVASLAGALRKLIEDSVFRRALGEAARQDHAERYDINSYVVRLGAIWRAASATAKTTNNHAQ